MTTGRYISLGVTFDSDNECLVVGADPIVNANTKYLFDFANVDTYPSQASNVANGTNFIDAVSGGGASVVALLGASAMNFSGSGISVIRESSANDARATIPGSGKLSVASPGLLFTVWIRHKTSSLTSGVAAIAGWTYQTGTGNQYSINYDFSAKTYNLRANGINHAIDASTWTDGQLAQLAVDWNSTDGSSVAYVNGAFHDTITAAGTIGNLKQPASVSGTAYAAMFSLAGFSGAWLGEIARIWLEESANTTHSATVSSDYNDNVSALS